MSKDYLDTVTDMAKFLSTTVQMNKSEMDKWIKSKLPLWKRIYKWLFPTRYYVNDYVKRYIQRKLTEKLHAHIDRFLAFGDTIQPLSKGGIISKEEMDRMRLKGIFE